MTISTVGYGDISPSYTGSRIVICFLIVTILVLLPMQLNQLSLLLSLKSPFRGPFQPFGDATHVLVCGHVTDREKLEMFFREFFHADRMGETGPNFSAVVVSTVEPSGIIQFASIC